MIFSNNDKYEGQFEFGMRNGRGKMYIAADDKQFTDFWVNDKRLDDGNIDAIAAIDQVGGFLFN